MRVEKPFVVFFYLVVIAIIMAEIYYHYYSYTQLSDDTPEHRIQRKRDVISMVFLAVIAFIVMYVDYTVYTSSERYVLIQPHMLLLIPTILLI